MQAARAAVLLSVVACVIAPGAASASQFGYEGSEIVARADAGEPMASFRITVDPTAGTVRAIDETRTGTPPFQTQRGAPRAGERCRNETIERATVPFQSTVCPLDGATGLRIDWTGATPDPAANPAPMPSGRFATATFVTGDTLPLAYQGGAGPEGLSAVTTAAVVADTGDGDDGLEVTAASGRATGGGGNDIVIANSPGGAGLQVDAGPGDDGVSATLGEGASVIGGGGDDLLNVSTWTSDPEAQARTPVRRQRVDCGDGADTLIADVRDEAGPGCAAAPAGLRERMKLGTFDRKGRVRVTLGRVARPSAVRYRLVGPEPPKLSPNASPRHQIPYGKPAIQAIKRVKGKIRAKVKLLASVRKALRKTPRRSIGNASAHVDVLGAGDVTTVSVGGVLRRAR